VQLVRGQPVERLDHRFVRQRQCLGHRVTLDELRRHRAGGDRAAAAEGFELRVRNRIALDLQVDLHDVAALGVAHLADAVRILDHADVARVAEVIHHLFAVKCHAFSPFLTE